MTWYDSMTVDGAVAWQGGLTDRNQAFFEAADDMFVDFRWTPDRLAASGNTAERLGRDRYELWAGVDVEAGGWNTAEDWDAIVPGTAPTSPPSACTGRSGPATSCPPTGVPPATSTPPTTGSGPAGPSTRPARTTPTPGGRRPCPSPTGRR